MGRLMVLMLSLEGGRGWLTPVFAAVEPLPVAPSAVNLVVARLVAPDPERSLYLHQSSGAAAIGLWR